MLDKIRQLLNSLTGRNLDLGGIRSIRLDDLVVELELSIAENRIRYATNEGVIAKLQVEKCQLLIETDKIQQVNLKQCKQRRIRTLEQRIERLDRHSQVYNENIDLHQELIDRIACMKASGLKQISQEQLEELTIEISEAQEEHSNIINEARLAFYDR